MNLKYKFILQFAIGFAMGMLICTIITSVIATASINDGNTYFCDPAFSRMFSNEIVAFLVQMIISGLFGAICMGGTIVYEIEEWSILKATAIHFVIANGTFVITATILKWWNFDNILADLIYFGVVIIAYILIWLIQYMIYKIEVKKIKRSIKEFRKKDKTK